MDHPTFNFERKKIIEHSETAFNSYEEEINYLDWIKTEYQCNPPKLDPNTRHPVKFVACIEKQIQYRKDCMERDKKAAQEDEELCSITGDRGSIVRIFEAMKKAEIIETTTQTKYIVNIFFKNEPGKRAFQKYYSNTSKEINQLETKTSNPELVRFVKVLIEESFAGKKEILQVLREHISNL